MHKNIQIWEQFLNLQNRLSPDTPPGVLCITKPNTSINVGLLCCLHGNEIGNLPPVLQWIHNHCLDQIGNILAENTLPFSVTVIVGNPVAMCQDIRFTDKDLNRCFDDTSQASYEARRCAEFKPYLAKVSCCIDLHQTTGATPTAFWISPWHTVSYYMGKILGQYPMVTRKQGGFSLEGLCSDEWCHAQGIPCLTLETSQNGISAVCHEVVFGVLYNLEQFLKYHTTFPTPEFWEKAAGRYSNIPDLDLYCIVASVYAPALGFVSAQSLANFQNIEPNQVIATHMEHDNLVVPNKPEWENKQLFSMFAKNQSFLDALTQDRLSKVSVLSVLVQEKIDTFLM
jgi:Succinylglutamate desuccinylase / Aspartoacylase family